MKYLNLISSHVIHPFSINSQKYDVNISRLEEMISISTAAVAAIFINMLAAPVVFYSLTAFFKFKYIRAFAPPDKLFNLYILPSEILNQIISGVSVRDLHSLLLVNKNLLKLVKATSKHKEIAILENATTSLLDYCVFTKHSRFYVSQVKRNIVEMTLFFYSNKRIVASRKRLSELEGLKINYQFDMHRENMLAKKYCFQKLIDLIGNEDEYKKLTGIIINRNHLIPKEQVRQWKSSWKYSVHLIHQNLEKWKQLSNKYEIARINFCRKPEYCSYKKKYDWNWHKADGIIVKEKNEEQTVCYHLYIEHHKQNLSKYTTGWYYEKFAKDSEIPEKEEIIVNRDGNIVNQTLYDQFKEMLNSH